MLQIITDGYEPSGELGIETPHFGRSMGKYGWNSSFEIGWIRPFVPLVVSIVLSSFSDCDITDCNVRLINGIPMFILLCNAWVYYKN